VTPRQVINLVLSISIGFSTVALLGTIAVFFVREWRRNR
jgi:hypothetical protein